MYRLTLHLDAELLATHGPEVQWAWRTLLTGMGYAWQVVDGHNTDCDIAHTVDPVVRGRARVTIDASTARWAGGTMLRLAGLADHGEWVVPRYDRGDDGAPLVDDDGASLRIRRDVIFDAFWLATGQEESAFARNSHGHLDLDASPYLTEGTLRRAVASGIGASLHRALVGQGLPPPLPRWPHRKRAAAAGTHDVDYPEVIRWLEPLRVVARQGLRGVAAACAVAAGRRSHWQFDAWIAAERRHGVRSAFYFVARQGSLTEYVSGTPDSFYDIGAPMFRDLFARLRDAGVEIGLHASYRACERPGSPPRSSGSRSRVASPCSATATTTGTSTRATRRPRSAAMATSVWSTTRHCSTIGMSAGVEGCAGRTSRSIRAIAAPCRPFSCPRRGWTISCSASTPAIPVIPRRPSATWSTASRFKAAC